MAICPFRWLGVGLAAACASAPGSALHAAPVLPPPPGAGLFAESNSLHRFGIDLADAEAEALRQNPRKDVRASVRHGGRSYAQVGLHLKGRSGSFQALDGKPSITLRFDRFIPGQTLDGLTKVHLNNSAEDPTYLSEAIGSSLFLEAGVPTPRVAHALVALRGRPLGLYVLKEGFTREFLALHFTKTDGNLYEHVSSPEGAMWRRESGSGPDDRLDLASLEKICAEPELQKRWALFPGVLDTDRFLSFLALEILLVHRDGYALAVNNHWSYHDPASDRIVFLPHGMDRLLGRSDLPLRPRVSGPVARSLLEIPEATVRYRTRVEFLFTNLLADGRLVQRIQTRSARLLSASDLSAASRREIQQEVNLLQQRAAARVTAVSRQLQEPERLPLRFTNGPIRLSPWRPLDIPADGLADESPAPDGRSAFHLQAGRVTSASWRCRQLLEPGRYEFRGRARTAGVKPLGFGRNQGAGLRVSGFASSAHQMTGDGGWSELSVGFEVTSGEREVEFVCQLRGSQGHAWFERDSLRLSRLP